jgi:hypothetical protein
VSAVLKNSWVVLGFAIGGVFIYLSLRSLNWQTVMDAFARAHIGWLLLCLPVCALAFLIRLHRWWLMLRAIGSKATHNQIAAPFFGGFALNNVLPFRMGDVARAAAFTRRLDVSASGATASLLVERVFDLYALLLIGFVAMLAMVQLTGILPFSGGVTAIAGAGAVLMVLTAVLTIPKTLGRLFLWMLKLPPGRLVPRGLKRFGLRALIHVSHIVRREGSLRLIGLSVLAWIIEGGVIYAAVQALGLSSALVGPWLAIAFGNLGTLLPGTPGHFGTFHYLASHALALAGTDFSAGFLAITLAHFIIWGSISLTGFALLLSTGGLSSPFQRRRLQATSQAAQPDLPICSVNKPQDSAP